MGNTTSSNGIGRHGYTPPTPPRREEEIDRSSYSGRVVSSSVLLPNPYAPNDPRAYIRVDPLPSYEQLFSNAPPPYGARGDRRAGARHQDAPPPYSAIAGNPGVAPPPYSAGMRQSDNGLASRSQNPWEVRSDQRDGNNASLRESRI